ncbi:MAG: molybdate ABC transporter permease subunit [Saprospiraceae bacterium]|nr:molybdate ABC transporter permease subunit [Saprospiraceae bacterium]MCB9321972.1 molybdate ABC transporter permease subunit [Lewinellaceae bacterium]
MDWQPIVLSLELAGITTVILLLAGIPLAYLLANLRSRWKPFLETLISMPLVLPPTVLGFYMLVAFSPNYFFGAWMEKWLAIRLVFSFGGLVIASMIYSLPFMVQPIQAALQSLPHSLTEAGLTLGKSRWVILRRILIPNIRPAILTGTVLSFAHTIGEFGVILMIGGNIPGRTRVASVAIFEAVETLNYRAANGYALVLLIITFLIVWLVSWINGRSFNTWNR